jgi:putative ABC transport system ATP-binding protein
MIHLEDVSKVFRPINGSPVHALSGVNLGVSPGQFVVVRGPSGSGKSTLLSLIGGLARPTSGRVVVAGQDLPAMSPSARASFRARRIGFVFQTFHLLPYLTVLENVLLAAPAGQQATSRGRARELLQKSGLGHRTGHRAAELSTGESQRVAIARALVNAPGLVLADEPTGNLDPDNAGAVLDLLSDFHRGGGTVLLVTHQEAADRYADAIVLLRDGKVVG